MTGRRQWQLEEFSIALGSISEPHIAVASALNIEGAFRKLDELRIDLAYLLKRQRTRSGNGKWVWEPHSVGNRAG